MEPPSTPSEPALAERLRRSLSKATNPGDPDRSTEYVRLLLTEIDAAGYALIRKELVEQIKRKAAEIRARIGA